MPILQQLKEAIQRTKDEGGTVGHWFEYIRVKDFLILLTVLFFAGAAVYSIYNNVFNPCEHQFNYSNYSYSSNYSCVFVTCEKCNQRISFKGTKEYPYNENYEPTCTREGKYTELWTYGEVTAASTRFSYSIPALGHLEGDVIDSGTPATCHRSGISETRICLRCNEQFGGEFVDILGHDSYNEGYIEPTCTQVGYTGYELCHRCDEIIQENTIIPMLDHVGVEGTFEASYNISSYTGFSCKNCGFPISINEKHSEPLINQYFEYQLTDDETGYIITAIKKTEKDMVIPDHIDGIPVVYMVEGLFKDNSILENISLSNNLLEIKDYTFTNCTNLKHIIIPDSVSYVGIDAFKDCINLLTVDLGQGVSKVEAEAFGGCIKLLSFKFPQDYNLYENDINFQYIIPVIRAPKKFRYTNFKGDWINCLPEHIYGHLYNDSYDYIYEEDGAYFYNDDVHKVLLYCDDRYVKENILFIPEGTNIIGEDLLLKIRNIEGIVLPRSVYKIMHQRWDKDEWKYVYPSAAFNYLNYYYDGTPEEFDFIDKNGVGAYRVNADATEFTYFYDRGEDYVYNNWDNYRWKFDENGLPILTRDNRDF